MTKKELIILWEDRTKTLRACSLLVHNEKLSQSLDWMADAYTQCANELKEVENEKAD